MSYRKAESLSPCYNSTASPDIPESHVFRWQPRHTQTSATITIYIENMKTAVKTYRVSGSQTSVDIGSIGYAFKDNGIYWWSVVTHGPNGSSKESFRARFKYERVASRPSIVWNHIPREGETIVRDTYFKEIKDNVKIILSDYSGVSNTLKSRVDALFTGQVIPEKKDFEALESVVDFLSLTLENVASTDIDEPVEDSLGVSDLEVIRKHIDKLTRVKPLPPPTVGYSLDKSVMYKINSLRLDRSGVRDSTIDVSWTFVHTVPRQLSWMEFTSISKSRDVRYYQVRYEYGPSNKPYASEIFFSPDHLKEEKYTRRVDTDWDNLYTATTLSKAMHKISISAVDHRGNVSAYKEHSKMYGSKFKVPLGVKNYELQYQKAPLSATGPNLKARWYTIYEKQNSKYTHKLTGGDGKLFYRVKAIDVTGLETDWKYSVGIDYIPKKAPAAPKNFRADNIEKYRMGLYWDKPKEATKYQLKRGSTVIYSGPKTAVWSNNLKSNTSYTYYVRAGNEVGWSKWVSTKARTKPSRKTTTWTSRSQNTWSEMRFWQNNDLVMQGEWCNNWSTTCYIWGDGARCYGRNRGSWLFNHSHIQSTLKGKKIIKVEMEIRRHWDCNGRWQAEAPTFWLHNQTSHIQNAPFRNSFTSKKRFAIGERAWTELPISYGNALRDGTSKGIGIYHKGYVPYIIFVGSAKLRITYE